MALINPVSLSVATAAAKAFITAVPKHQLGRLGLTKTAPLLAPLPVALAGGAALATALAIPKSRRWLLQKGSESYGAARALLQSDSPKRDEEEVEVPVEVTPEVDATGEVEASPANIATA